MKYLTIKNNLGCLIRKNQTVVQLFNNARTYSESNRSFAVAVPASLQNDKLRVDDKLHGFKFQKIESVPEFQLTAYKLIHERTGGEYLHIERNDDNNVFAVSFRTTPTDSTGLPHILEHITLCGSQKYPCRDPFFKMLNRSLTTFMNAMTGADYTLYPFSTKNPKDFENLMSVYLDAVFRPNLREMDFSQEGWRLEHSDVNDPNSPIIIKGVVFNEMKGVFSENQNIFFEALQNNILPTNTYGVISGGDPLVIPQLKHSDLRNFHKKYYSPGNARYYSYGNLPLENHLKFLNDNYLRNMDNDAMIKKLTEVPNEERWKKMMRKDISCHPDPLSADVKKTSSIAVSYLGPSVNNIEEVFTMQVLSELLVKGPNSLFYKTLVEPNIGAGFSPVTGFSNFTKDTLFTVGLQGVDQNDFNKITKIVDETVETAVQDGFKSELIEAVLHGYELNIKHQSSDFGLSLLFGLTSIWNHDGDVLNALRTESHIKNFKQKINDKSYLKNKMKQYFKNNNHKLILTMSPDQNFGQDLQNKENILLRNKLDSLNKSDIDKIYKNGLELLADQSKEQDVSCLPTLKIEDLSKSINKIEYSNVILKKTDFQIVEAPTNGITYFRGLINSSCIKSELKSYLPLFTYLSTRMGTKTHNYKDFDQLIQLNTGGLSLGTHIRPEITNINTFEENLLFASYCLDRNVDQMYNLWFELLTNVSFDDKQRFETLVKVHAADLANGIMDSGHHLAMLLSASLISPVGLIKESFGGLTYINKMNNCLLNLDETLNNVEEISSSLFHKKNFKCCLNVCEKNEIINKSKNFVELFKVDGNSYEEEKTKTNFEPKVSGVFHVLPSNVSFTSKSLLSVPYKHEDFAPLRILSRLVSLKYLLKEVREKGGAYGAGLTAGAEGTLTFYSYRDPNPVNTFNVFDNTLNWLKNYKIKDIDVEEAKLGVFQTVDAPIPPGNIGLRRFLLGVEDKEFAEHRLNLMKVTKYDLLNVADKYFNLDSVCGRALLGPENIVNNSSQNWKISN